jgi:Protein of unknown function (DUF3667)
MGAAGDHEAMEASRAVSANPAELRPAAVTTGSMTTARCKNCGAALLGRYCVDCSQAADVHVPSTRELLHEAMEGLTHADSRLWRTLVPLWFKPGKLTNEFIAGRRTSYVPPFRLYLVLSVIFFLIASFHGSHGQLIQFDPADARQGAQVSSCSDWGFEVPGHPAWKPRIVHACQEIQRDNGNNLLHVTLSAMPKAMFIFLPLIAFLNMLMYWRPRHRYAEHLLFFLHVHAFFFSVAIALMLVIDASEAWPVLDTLASVVATLLGWSLAVYTFMAMRRVFKRGWIRTFLKAFVLFIAYFVVAGIGVAGVVVYAALTL